MTRRDRIWTAIAYAPVLLVAYVSFVYVWNFFYAWKPVLYDAGWFAYLEWHNGVLPKSPHVLAYEVVDFWGWHVSPLVSLGSILSYAFPLDRADWYCVFQAAIHVPYAFAVPLLVRRDARSSLWLALVAAVCSIAFFYGGQVVQGAAFPHFENFASAGMAIMLAALATGRERLAWCGLLMSVATREDGGLHAGMFLLAVLASDLTKRPFPIARARVVRMTIVAFALTAIALVIQNKFFVTPGAWERELVGKPPYAHLTSALLRQRIDDFMRLDAFVWAPLLGTALVAVARRDVRYLFGWIATAPWFLLNFTAKQEFKADFELYTGFPFIGSVFWVGAYAIAGERRRPLHPMLAVATLSALSLLGLYTGFAPFARLFVVDGLVPAARNRDGLRSLSQSFRKRDYGLLHTDLVMASWAVDTLRAGDTLLELFVEHDFGNADAYAFVTGPKGLTALVQGSFPKCGRVPRTEAFVCMHAERPLLPPLVPGDPWLSGIAPHGTHARRARESDAIVVDAAIPELATIGPFVQLLPGRYRATWQVSVGACNGEILAPELHVDVWRGETTPRAALVAAKNAWATETKLEIEFDVGPETRAERFELRSFTGRCGYTIEGVDLRRVPNPTSPLP